MGKLHEIVSGFGPGEWALVVVASIALLGTIITGASALGAAFIHIYPQLKKQEQKNVDNQTPDTNGPSVGPHDEGDDSISGIEQKESPWSKVKFSKKAWLLFLLFLIFLVLSEIIISAFLPPELIASMVGGTFASVVGGLIVGYISGRIRTNTPGKEIPEKTTVSSEPKAPQKSQLPPVVETPKAGEVREFELTDGVKLEMVWCPAGSFTMGSPDGKSEYPLGSEIDPKAELGRFNNEAPHEVTLTKGFWIGKYPVTQIQYKAITGENPSYFKGNNRPVEEVSWNDSVTFCEKLNELKIAPEGYKFALPTEAQWEYACRAETTTALNNGKPITSENGECPNLDKVGWYGKNSEGKTHLVGQKEPNAWGIYDMHGNVWEWCRDCCRSEKVDGVWLTVTDTYKDGIEDPLCETGEHRVVRGGSWGNYARRCRSANRRDVAPVNRSGYKGFRLVLIPE